MFLSPRCARVLGLFGLLIGLVGCGRPDGAPAPASSLPLPTPRVQAQPPAAAPPPAPVELASAHYRNVPLLGELSRDEFDRSMQAITAWVAPKTGCSHCHVDGDPASDSKPAKQTARRMLQMVQQLNTNWKPHVGAEGVTCYTCHRGEPQPPQRLAANDGAKAADCTHCHEAPGAPAAPSPDKQTRMSQAEQGVRLLQVLNTEWLADSRATGRGQPADCATCHHGRHRPGGDGAPRARDYAALMLVPIERAEVERAEVARVVGHGLAAAAAARPPTDRCAQAAAAAARSGQRIPADSGLQAVLGAAPLALFAAPDAACAMLELPVPQDQVLEAFVTYGGYTSVRYRRPATGSEVRGWARAERLGAGRSASPLLAQRGSAVDVSAAAGQCPNAPASIDEVTPTAERVRQQVQGRGRLQFYAVPDAGCPLRGIFILPGEPVLAVRRSERFTAVLYVNPRTGGHAKGWVLSERLGGG